MSRTPIERFWSKVEKTPTCWNWTAARLPTGYGVLGFDGRNQYAHRVAYMISVGPIPQGLVIDHLCRNTSCVRPDHLEAVTHRENTWRGILGERWRQDTHCVHGHEYTPENTYRYPNRDARNCRTCTRNRAARQQVAS